jgi:ATP adenylyltransferase
MAYLESGASGGAVCFLCAAAEDDPQQSLVVWRGVHVYALLNAFPYANGHLLLAPYAHLADLDTLPAAAARELMTGCRRMIAVLRAAFTPQGFNVGANLGSAAGAGFGDHLHLHIVPRWSGDTNFMTTVGGARVIPEDLADTAARLRQAANALEWNGE